jgi:hypothetical protein
VDTGFGLETLIKAFWERAAQGLVKRYLILEALGSHKEVGSHKEEKRKRKRKMKR